MLLECLVGAATYPQVGPAPKPPKPPPTRGVLLAPVSFAGAAG
jgi:hypothetical protein